MKYQYRTYLTSRPSWYLTHPWEIFIELYKEIKCFIQRGYRGYANSDLWNFDNYLSIMIPIALRQFAECHCGYPGTIEIDTDEKWTKTLKDIADGIEAPIITEDKFFKIDKDGSFKTYNKKLKEAYTKQDKALKLFSKYFNNFWD